MTACRVIVTRPAYEAARWTALLDAHGIRAQALPLIEIAPLADVRALQNAWARIDRGVYRALMFVSAQAVRYFFAPRAGAGADHADATVDANVDVDVGADTDSAPRTGTSNARPRHWATGAGTVAALLAAGVDAQTIDAPPADAPAFDSEALWSRVRAQVQPGARVLIVRGAQADGVPSGRDWLARAIAAAGAQADNVAAYRRLAPVFDAAQHALARQAAADGSLWLFGSSQAIGNLCAALPEVDWRLARALTTHPRIAQAAQTAGFGEVHTSAPGQAAVIEALLKLCRRPR
ncbi:MAG: uroporphyrinogen-III synthase [Burkholderiaceae bacterium]|jgi:uroporphyrinogen-III synthase|nr:uroporphyrinogen-III synthase [Burkholderiaceae bacterium]